MKVTVCELPDDATAYRQAWKNLSSMLGTHQSELVVLPEMPAYPWFVNTPSFDDKRWQEALEAHNSMVQHLPDFSSAAILGTRPCVEGTKRLNRGFIWTPSNGERRIHDKYYLPNEENFYESTWFHRPAQEFQMAQINHLSIGFLICTEVMFNQRARYYGQCGCHLLVVPRASGGHERWKIALQMAAIVSGSFVLSSNRSGTIFGGQGLIIAPDGTILACTSEEEPYQTIDITLEEAIAAKQNYPCYIQE